MITATGGIEILSVAVFDFNKKLRTRSGF